MRYSVAKVIFLLFVSVQLLGQDLTDFSKGGKVHRQAIALWDTHYRDHWTTQIQRRLVEQGDVYVLYDVQIGGLQSFVEMNRRCGDVQQLREIAQMLTPTFAQLRPVAGENSSNGWVCTGGTTCPAYNLTDKEVPLCSSQFLGLLGAVATAMRHTIPDSQLTQADQAFLSSTYNTMAVHLNRWFDSSYFQSVNRRTGMSKDDIKDGSSRFFFTDRDLWFLTILSDLSELHLKGVRPIGDDGKQAFVELQGKKDGIGKTFDLFLDRLSFSPTPSGLAADLEKGYWRLFFDNKYALYEGKIPPVSWQKQENGKDEMITHVPWDSSYLAPDAGWDISHARRLVPALETFARNQLSIRELWGYDHAKFDPQAIRKAFATQIAEKIWNKDLAYPLFSNYWSGDNGWYRVAYAAHTGRQFSGYPPYGLSNSIPSGGYPMWGTLHPQLDAIFRRLYELAGSDEPKAQEFMLKHYGGLIIKSSEEKKRTPSLSFLSDLVESR
jgi:hypothetical protein